MLSVVMKFKNFLIYVILLIVKQGKSDIWKCNDGFTIDSSWKCDGQIDCIDGSDETLENCPIRQCRYDEYRCHSGSCIPFSLVCNGEVDCNIGGIDDNSDETYNCNATKQTSSVECDPSVQYKCSIGLCIPQAWLCDNMDDCGDNSDESDCDDRCRPDYVMCNNSLNCISRECLCDGYNDCGDDEDEVGCLVGEVTSKKKLQSCENGKFQCGEKCLPIEKACDGNNDCPGGEDEGIQCSLGECRSRRDPLTWGIKNGKPLCDQGCRHTPEGPMCFCQSGYRLEPDGIRCKAEGASPPKLLFAIRNEIRSVPLSSISSEEKVLFRNYVNPKERILSLDYDLESETMIWLDDFHASVHLMNAFYQKIKLIQVIGVQAIFLDWITQNVYVIFESPGVESDVGIFSLYDANLSSNPTLYKLRMNISKPHALALHPDKRKMVLIDREADSVLFRLLEADMDGNNMITLEKSEGTFQMNAITIDYVTDIVYWSESNQIQSSIKYKKLGVKGLTKILTSVTNKDKHFFKPSALSVFEGQLYFYSNESRELWSIDSSTGKPSNFVKQKPVPFLKIGVASNFLVFRIYHSVMQNKSKENPCKNSRCSHLCVLRPAGVRCLCPQPMILDESGNTCVDLEFTAKLSKMSPSIRLSHSFVNTTSATLKKIKATSTNTLFTKKYCPLPNISHFGGKLVIPSNFSFFKIGSKLLFICDRGWFVKGYPAFSNITLTCTSNSTWDSNRTTCVRHNCSTLNCGIEGVCKSAETGAVCHCFDGKKLFSICPKNRSSAKSSHTISSSIKFLIFILVLLLTAVIGFVWRQLKKKHFLLLQKKLKPSLVYIPLPEEDSATNKKVELHFLEKALPSLGFNNPWKQQTDLSSSEDLDSGLERSSSSLSSSSGPMCNCKILKESRNLDIESLVNNT